MATKRLRIGVIGCGIIGISTAYNLIETAKEHQHADSSLLGEVEVDILCDKMPPLTTSNVAAGFWEPFVLDETPPENVLLWSKETFDFLTNVISSKSSNESNNFSGVFFCPGFDLSRKVNREFPDWHDIPIGFREAVENEMQMFPPKYKSAFFFISIVAEPEKFLPYLLERFFRRGGLVKHCEKVNNFREIAALGYDVIVNCTGIGSRELCGDDLVYPSRGQVHRVNAPWQKFFVMDDEDDTYAIPNSATVVCGGVCEKNNYSTNINEVDKMRILTEVRSLIPALRNAPVMSDHCGLRPARRFVRVEKDASGIIYKGEKVELYHNYGHGGAGFTLFWGCAKKIGRLVFNDIKQATRTASHHQHHKQLPSARL